MLKNAIILVPVLALAWVGWSGEVPAVPSRSSVVLVQPPVLRDKDDCADAGHEPPAETAQIYDDGQVSTDPADFNASSDGGYTYYQDSVLSGPLTKEHAMRDDGFVNFAAGIGASAALLASTNPHAADANVTMLMRQALQDHPGKEGVVAVVEFPPGHVDPAHRHPAHVFVYVVEGEVEMQLKGGTRTRLKPGDTFYENPNDVHPIGRNVSKTKPAKLLVFLVKDPHAPLTLPPW